MKENFFLSNAVHQQSIELLDPQPKIVSNADYEEKDYCLLIGEDQQSMKLFDPQREIELNAGYEQKCRFSSHDQGQQSNVSSAREC